MRMTVADLMSEMPVTVGPTCTADEALDAFFEYETPELYVVDSSRRLLGVLPDYELLKVELSGEAGGARVDQLMTRAIPVVSMDSDAAEVARLFKECHCSRIPVTKAGRLMGLVTRADVLRLMAVFRRIDAQHTEAPAKVKKPKHLSSAKSTATRTTRGKSVNLKATKKLNSKPSRRSSAKSVR